MNTNDVMMANCKLCGSQANVYDIPSFSHWITNHGCTYGRLALPQIPNGNAAIKAQPLTLDQTESFSAWLDQQGDSLADPTSFDEWLRQSEDSL